MTSTLLLAQAGPGGGSPIGMIGMVAIFIAIFYFILWRPQQKQAKAHRKMLDELKKGDGVVTRGGLIGKVYSLADKHVVLELARDVRVRVLKTAISAKAPEGFFESAESSGENLFKE